MATPTASTFNTHTGGSPPKESDMSKRKTRKQKLRQNPDGPKGKSRYAQKVRSGNQMYGDGKRCCGHGLSPLEPKAR